MTTIGRIPTGLCSFFSPQRQRFSKRARSRFWGLLTAMVVGMEYTSERLNGLLRGQGHRANDGELLSRSRWHASEVLRAMALRMFAGPSRAKKPICFFLGDTQKLTRAKKMNAVGRLHYDASHTYGTRRAILSACLSTRVIGYRDDLPQGGSVGRRSKKHVFVRGS